MPERHARNLDEFIGETCFVLRRYWLGRSIVSAIVAAVVGIAALLLDLPLVPTLVVVTFVGGFVPYLGAVVGGLLAVVLGLATGGIVDAGIMLVTVLFANLVVENAVEPYVTGRTLQIHPLVVLLATTVGGIVGGLAGLVMAVPLTVIAGRALPRLARRPRPGRRTRVDVRLIGAQTDGGAGGPISSALMASNSASVIVPASRRRAAASSSVPIAGVPAVVRT